MKLILLSGLLFISLLFFAQNTFAQNDSISHEEQVQYVEPASSPASLSMITPPDGFEATDRFNGFIHYKTGSAIIMTLIKDATYLNIAKGMTEEFFQQNKLTLISERKVVTNNGTKGVDFKFSFVIQDIDFIRHMVYVGDLNQTLWLAITYPKMGEELVEDEVLKCIQTINLNPVSDEK